MTDYVEVRLPVGPPVLLKRGTPITEDHWLPRIHKVPDLITPGLGDKYFASLPLNETVAIAFTPERALSRLIEQYCRLSAGGLFVSMPEDLRP